MFYDCGQRVPLIVVDPSHAADGTRGTVEPRFVESVDVLPTILASLNIAAPRHRIEGRALQGLLNGAPADDWRDAVFCELDWSFKEARLRLGMQVQQCRAWCIRTVRWRYVYWLDQPEQLFDLQADPQEFVDLGRQATHAAVRETLRTRLFDWLARRKRRTTISDERVEQGTGGHKRAGVFYGQW